MVPPARLELRAVGKTYPGGSVGVEAVDLTVEDGEVFVIVGPSGSGKTTLLRLIAGLESAETGTISLGGRRIDQLAPSDRNVAMVFQEQVVYPHLDVFGNIAFGLRARGGRRAEIESQVQAAATVLGLESCLGRRPSTLSGGQRRRVTLARAMVLRPGLFLLDEPFSGLDAPLRSSTRAELVELRRRLGATMVLVTHDQAEALAIGDRVAVIDGGRIVQVGPPREIYERPASRFVSQFVGQPPMAILPCLATRDGEGLRLRILDQEEAGTWEIPLPSGWTLPLPDVLSPRVDLGLRPEDISIRSDVAGGEERAMGGPAIVRRLELTGHEIVADLSIGQHSLSTRVPSSSPIRVGDRVVIALDLERASWFDPITGVRIARSAGPERRSKPLD